MFEKIIWTFYFTLILRLVSASCVRQFVSLLFAIPITNCKNNIKQVGIAL